MKKDQIQELNYWNNFYNKIVDETTFDIPSQFCCFMAIDIKKDTAILEFGCGNGKDSFF